MNASSVRPLFRSLCARAQRSLLSGAIRSKQFSALHNSVLRPQKARIYPRKQYRQASTVATDVRSAGTRTKNLVFGTGLIFALTFGYLYITDTRAGLHQWIVIPAMRILHADAEDAHHAGVSYLKTLYKFGLHPRERSTEDVDLKDIRVEVFGHIIDNPVGVSAGLDKDADVPDALLALGAGLVEVGGATPLPQEGNPKPRVFRIPSQNALINRYGLNSKGADHMAVQLRERVRQYAYDNGFGLTAEAERLVLDGGAGVPPGSLQPGRLLAVQMAKNKTTPDDDIDAVAADYVYCVKQLGKYADVLVVNVSSPNTPGLRDLQAVAPLTTILSAVVKEARKVERKSSPAVMVKVSPDEDSNEQIEGICTAIYAAGVDGVIVGNTTKKRPDTIPKGYNISAKEQQTLSEIGGYSGPQMFQRTLDLVKKYRQNLDQRDSSAEDSFKTIFASGGITNGQQCLDVLHAGASVCQMYTAMMYGGVGTITRVKSEIRDEIRKYQK